MRGGSREEIARGFPAEGVGGDVAGFARLENALLQRLFLLCCLVRARVGDVVGVANLVLLLAPFPMHV